jgi:hypothetical protein
MTDRKSTSSYKGTVGEGVVGIKADVKTIKQLTSSSDAAKAKRYQGGLHSLESAVQKEMQNSGAKQESQQPKDSGHGGSG